MEQILTVLGAWRENTTPELSAIQGDSDWVVPRFTSQREICHPGASVVGRKHRNKQPHQTTMWRRDSCRCKALVFLTLCGALWPCFPWDSKDSKVISVQGSQRLNKFKMTCPASLGVIPLCIPFCAEHSFMMRSFIDGIISI